MLLNNYPRFDRIQANLMTRSMMKMKPGRMNHFQKFGPWSMTRNQNGTYSK